MVTILVYYNCKIELKQSAIVNDLWFCFGLVPTCKRLVPGAIPSINLPEKSIPSPLQLHPDVNLFDRSPSPNHLIQALKISKRKLKN